jgi:hypothetical protein
MAQTYAGARRFSDDINVAKKPEIPGVPAGFQILLQKENEAEIEWRWMQS